MATSLLNRHIVIIKSICAVVVRSREENAAIVLGIKVVQGEVFTLKVIWWSFVTSWPFFSQRRCRWFRIRLLLLKRYLLYKTKRTVVGRDKGAESLTTTAVKSAEKRREENEERT